MKKLFNLNKLNSFLFFLILFLQSIHDYTRTIFAVENFGDYKNGILILIAFILQIQLFIRKKDEIYFKNEFKRGLLLCIFILIISLYFAIKNSFFSLNPVRGCIQILIPLWIAFLLLNLIELEDIYKIMKISLLFCFILYILAKGISLFSLSNFLSISFLKSKSLFESDWFAPQAFGFCVFFSFFDKDLRFKLLSLLFVFLTFKRVFVVAAIILFVYSLFFSKDETVNKNTVLILEISVILFTLFFNGILTGQFKDIFMQIIGMDVSNLTMYRTVFYDLLLNSSFVSGGFETAKNFSKDIEMDLIRILLEIGFLGLCGFVVYYGKLIKNNFYLFFLLFFIYLELIFTRFYDVTYAWIIIYLLIGCVNYKNENIAYVRKPIINVKFKFSNRKNF